MAIEINTNENPNLTGHSYLDAKGPTRSLQLVQKTTRLGSQIGEFAGIQTSNTVKAFDQNLGTAVGALGLTRLPSVTTDALKALGELGKKDDGSSLQRKAAKAVKETTGAVSAYGYALSFIKANPSVKMIADATDFVSTSTDLGFSCVDYSQAEKYEQQPGITASLKKAYAHTKRYHLLGIAKNVSAIAAVILGFSLLYTGVTLIPAMIVTMISLTSTIFAVKKDMHESNGKVLKLDKEPYPQSI